MLDFLHIENIAVIEQADIEFGPGLNVLTGETGAGKSIILGALSLILGERADTKAIRDSSLKTVVAATFDITGYQLEDFFQDNDIAWVENECLMRRELLPNGRSRAFINDTPVSLNILRELSTRLVDIHSQHTNMLLSRSAFQLAILDNIAGNGEMLEKYRKEYQLYREAVKQLEDTRKAMEELRRNEDYIRFQLDQLQTIQLQANEDVKLEALQNKLANVTELKEGLWNIENDLNNDENSILERLSAIAQRLEAAQNNLTEVEGMADRVRTALIDLKDIAQSVRYVMDTLNDDPAELARVEDRLNSIYALERKHNAQDVNQLIDIQHEYERQLREIEYNDETIGELEALVQKRKDAAMLYGTRLSTARKATAKEFGKELLDLASPLGMKNLAFDVSFEDTDFSTNGIDAVEFMMAFNKNQKPMPVKDTASGGEISRVMLCIKTIIARHMQLPSIIFDEVDTGVSGDVANMIGEMMSSIAQNIQVIAITHLPQVAAYGDQHLRVFKEDNDVETLTRVEMLNEEDHIMEIARMLSGKGLNQAAIENAKSLIKHKNS